MNSQIKNFEESKFVSVRAENKGKRIKLKFSEQPPKKPGVYLIYLSRKKRLKPFYVGETRNLRQRLTTLFRCNSLKNPHPCQINFAKVIGKKIAEITYEDFCSRCKAKFISTEKLVGRIEIEEKLQKKYGTNCDSFYKKLITGS